MKTNKFADMRSSAMISAFATLLLGAVALGNSPIGTLAHEQLASAQLQTVSTTDAAQKAIAPAQGICNTSPIQINSYGTAIPYPSNIQVTGLTGTITEVTARLNGFRHEYPDDVDILLVGPQGQSTILMADAGWSCFRLADLTFKDGAPAMPDDGCYESGGTYRPSNYYPPVDLFPPYPASLPVYNTSMSVFKGTDPNGTWGLHVVDDTAGLLGNISYGWCLNIATTVAGDR